MSTTSLSGDDRLPRYQRLADELRNEVIQGAWRPGDRLPSENELAQQYNIAAGTVRQALRQLVEEGLLERFHGKGTFVRRPSFDASLFRFFRFRGANGETQIPESRILQLKQTSAPGLVSSKLKLPDNAKVIFISRLRLLSDVPVLVEEIWLPANTFKPLLSLNVADFGPLLYPLYDLRCGVVVARAEEDLTAEKANSATAKILRLDKSDPVIVVDRLAKGYDHEPLEWRRTRGRADQFHYHTELC